MKSTYAILPPFRLAPMTERRAAAVASWSYPPPYDRYNIGPWERLAAEGRELADPSIRESQYRSVLRGDELCGFVQWFPLLSERADGEPVRIIRLGVGLRPDLCGRGLGAAFAAYLAEEAAARFPGAAIDLEVASSNLRAVKAYERAGFRIEDEYDAPFGRGGAERVLCMVWRPCGPAKPPSQIE